MLIKKTLKKDLHSELFDFVRSNFLLHTRYFHTVTDMRFGRLRRARSGPMTYGLAMQSLG